MEARAPCPHPELMTDSAGAGCQRHPDCPSKNCSDKSSRPHVPLGLPYVTVDLINPASPFIGSLLMHSQDRRGHSVGVHIQAIVELDAPDVIFRLPVHLYRQISKL